MECTEYSTECKRGCSGVCAMANSYRPSNGTEGMIFEDNYCSHCIHDNPNPNSEKKCEIILAAMCFYPPEPEYPREWVYLNDKPYCTKFVKWDWGNDGDPDDPHNPKAPSPPTPVNQLNLFPLFPDETYFIPLPTIVTTPVKRIASNP
jgi:hypothetical protein